MIYQDSANKWAALCAASETMKGYVDRVAAHERGITYLFDGFIECCIIFVEGVWYEIGDHTMNMGTPNALHQFKHGATLEEVFALLEDEIAHPEKYDGQRC